MKDLTIGIELEFGLVDAEGVPRVSGRVIDADKHTPMDIDGILYHKDASMLEIAFPPCSSQEELDATVRKGVATAKGMLPPGWSLVTQCAIEYSDEELAFDPYASEMGCSPSENLYGLADMPDEYPDNVRYAGMHVNVGHALAKEEGFIFALDMLLSVPHITRLHVAGDADELSALRARRVYYGRAGEFRRRPFGIEYRTLPVGAWSSVGPTLFATVSDALLLDVSKHMDTVPAVRDSIQAAEVLA